MANYSKSKKYHFTYKTTNLINGRYYLGMHSTNRLDDGYLGSGTRLYRELNKYGRDNFKLEILEYFDTRDKLVEAEKTLITEQDLSNENCLNLKPGGTGGFVNEKHEKRFRKASNRTNYSVKNQDPVFRDKQQKGMEEHIKKLAKDPVYKEEFRNKVTKFYREQGYGTFKGKRHSQETKKKMSLAKKGKVSGIKNSQYGTCWITNGTENKKIKKGASIPSGWKLGRKIK